MNVEIFHRFTSCLRYKLYVDAPVHRVVRLGDGPTHDYDAENETCRVTYAASPGDEEESLSGGSLRQGPLDEGCAMEGRPFLDAAGTIQKAKLVQTVVPVWSAPSSSALETTPTDSKISTDSRSNLGEEWKRRAVGEHASIASFAAFTIALMANQAPPDLIQDSLTAAMNELRHAQVSFEMASLLTGTTIEPGSLPPSQLEFGNNLTTLALGVAREGCIDETLSALALAAALVDDTKLGDNKLLKLLRDATSQIAKEEGHHAILAWRTIHWVCSVDPQDACVVVKKEVLNPTHLKMAVQARFVGELGKTLEQAWDTLHEQLVPMVTSRK
jgi:hypothetical protein